jgi:hypothetical protein
MPPRPTPKKTTSPKTNPYSPLYLSSPESSSRTTSTRPTRDTPTTGTNTVMSPPPVEQPNMHGTTTTTTLPPLVLTVTRNNPRLAKEGFKTFQGLAANEQSMILDAIDTMLNDNKDKMRRFMGMNTVRMYKRKIQNDDLTIEELLEILVTVAKAEYVPSTGEAPHRLKYNTKFLTKYYPAQEQIRPGTQDAMQREDAVCGILRLGEQTRIESCCIRIPESMVESQECSPK